MPDSIVEQALITTAKQLYKENIAMRRVIQKRIEECRRTHDESCMECRDLREALQLESQQP